MDTSPAIGYLVPQFPTQTHAFFWREARALEEAGVRIQFLSTTRPPSDSCPHDFAASARERTRYLFPPRVLAAVFGLVVRPRRTAQAVGYVLGLRETSLVERSKLLMLVPTAMDLVNTARQQDIEHVHIHSCAKAAHLGALGNILDDLNYSLTLHGDLPVYGTDHPAKMQRARFVSAVTRPLQKTLETEIGKDRPYPLIWMGVDTKRFSPNPNRQPRELSDPLRILTVARLNAAKGHIYCLRAIAKLQKDGIDIHYQIAGEGAAQSDIEAEIEKLGLRDNVTLLGSVSEQKVLSLLHETHVVALTSIGLGEAAPVAVMEAMACGVPCVVSVIGGTPDMIDSGRNGILVPQKDVAAIADALGRITTEPGLLEAMSLQARKTAEEAFDHRQNALKLFAAIKGEFENL